MIILMIVVIVGFIIFFFVGRSGGICEDPESVKDVSGVCFKCPGRRTRDILADVNSSKACFGNCSFIYGDSSKYSVTFEDGKFIDGECYSCPKGMDRTILPINDDHACAGTCESVYGPGAFQDFLSGVCYICPAFYDRTLSPVTSPQACIDPKTGNYASARRLGESFSKPIDRGNRFSHAIITK